MQRKLRRRVLEDETEQTRGSRMSRELVRKDQEGKLPVACNQAWMWTEEG